LGGEKSKVIRTWSEDTVGHATVLDQREVRRSEGHVVIVQYLFFLPVPYILHLKRQ
jgi:hypothetical protein